MTINITFEEFERKYKPIKNTLNLNRDVKGYAFETCGKELEEVKKKLPTNVWTVCADNTTIVNGYNFASRVYYLLTEIPWKDSDIISVNLINTKK